MFTIGKSYSYTDNKWYRMEIFQGLCWIFFLAYIIIMILHWAILYLFIWNEIMPYSTCINTRNHACELNNRKLSPLFRERTTIKPLQFLSEPWKLFRFRGPTWIKMLRNIKLNYCSTWTGMCITSSVYEWWPFLAMVAVDWKQLQINLQHHRRMWTII